VHAEGQVIAFTYPGELPVDALTEALNGLLPPDVAVRDLRRVRTGFHPRYAARFKDYRYVIWNGPRSPLRARTQHWVRTPLDVPAMTRAATAFEGRHDFSAFGGADPQPVRTIHRVRIARSGARVTIDVRGDAFLRGMVRRMVAALIAVGTGRIDAEAVAPMLEARHAALGGAAAPAKGLTLRRVVLGRRDGRNDDDRNEDVGQDGHEDR
jgi:tRNA pseudouridine38-40 synthase